MNLSQAPAILGALSAFAIGVVVAIRPGTLAFLGLTASSALGKTEIRAVFGGWLIAAGAVCLVTQHPYAYLTAGAMCLVEAIVRLLALFIDRPPLSKGLGAVLVAVVLGGLLLSGFWTM